MISWRSSSSRGLGLALLGVALAAGCQPRVPEARPAPPRLALFPVQNLSGGAAPIRDLTAAIRVQLLTQGVVLVPDEVVGRVLARHRIRYTGGVDREGAQALREEAGADGVIIPALELYQPAPPFRMAMSVRVVSTDAEPVVGWIGSVARGGNDTPGVLGMGLVLTMEILKDEALLELSTDLATWLRTASARVPCPQVGSISPRRAFRSPLLDDPGRRTVAVLPFLNDSGRRDAGDVVTLRFLAPLLANGTVRVVEPGVVRTELLLHRIGASRGVSVDDARVVLGLLGADVVLSGTVQRFDEAAGTTGAPAVELVTWALDRKTARLAWASSSAASGDDGVFFFGAGRVTTASALTCGLARGTVAEMLEGRQPLAIPKDSAGFAPRGAADAR